MVSLARSPGGLVRLLLPGRGGGACRAAVGRSVPGAERIGDCCDVIAGCFGDLVNEQVVRRLAGVSAGGEADPGAARGEGGDRPDTRPRLLVARRRHPRADPSRALR
ncbi:hypothetical protein Acsp04_43620 [Actinomadura sp. NBRC 104425]|nr:hypothetical protein Acsp04_43620 [Actinomadura sp. NBRC 104425]